MRMLITHDRSGNVVGITTSDAPDAPPAMVALGPAYLTSEVDVSDDVLDVSRLESEQQIHDLFRDMRVVMSYEAILVGRDDKASSEEPVSSESTARRSRRARRG